MFVFQKIWRASISRNTRYKRDINHFTLALLKEKLLKVDWEFVNTINDPQEICQTFLLVIINLWEIAFRKIKVTVKYKTWLSPWIASGILKSSKRKQKLYENILKNRNSVNKENYKTFTRLFESIKLTSKKNYYHNLSVTMEMVWREYGSLLNKLGSK